MVRRCGASEQGVTSKLFTNIAGEVLPTVSHGRGVYLWDQDGTRYFDGCSGAVTANLGHGDPEIAAALADQAATVAFAYRSQFTNGPAEELAELVTSLAPPGLDRLFLVSSGSEAIEAAAKLARQYWVEVGQPERTVIVSRGTSYHGSTLGALELSDHPPRRAVWERVLDDPLLLPEANCYRCPLGLTHPDCDLACAQALDGLVELHADRIAAVVVEPVVGAAGGAVAPPAGYLERLSERCAADGILLIADEVMTGAWRTGGFLASADEGVVPDLVALGKGLAAGYAPLAGVLVSDRVAGAIHDGSGVFAHGHTHGFNPLSARAGLAVVRAALDRGVPANVVARGAQLGAGLDELAARHEIVGQVRGRGLLWGIELVADRDTRRPLLGPGGSAAVAAVAKRHGLLVYPAGVGQTTVVLVAPPLVVTEAEVDELLALLDVVLAAVGTPD
jgi:adenosylmethionine-8-amino-7-oxononanoate aminotransferase